MKVNCNGCKEEIRRSHDRCKRYCSSKCQREYYRRKRLKKFKKTLDWSVFGKRQETIKKHFIRTRKHKCEICGISKWNGKKLMLIMDHKDGNHFNQKDENLRLICSNCDSQLPTYRNRRR